MREEKRLECTFLTAPLCFMELIILMITSPAWPGLLDSDAICHHCCLFIVLTVSARMKWSAHAAHFWNAVALFNTVQQGNRSAASVFPAGIFISRVNTSRCAAAARNSRTEQPTPFSCFVFFSPLFHFLLQRRPVAVHMMRPVMTERLRGPRPKHLAVLYTSPPHRQLRLCGWWRVGRPTVHSATQAARASHTHTHTLGNIQVTSRKGDDVTGSEPKHFEVIFSSIQSQSGQ